MVMHINKKLISFYSKHISNFQILDSLYLWNTLNSHYRLEVTTMPRFTVSKSLKKRVETETKNGNISSARRLLEKAVSNNYRDYDAWVLYSNWEIRMNDFGRARLVLDRAVQIFPLSIDLWKTLVEMEESKFSIALARSRFQSWIALNQKEAFEAFISFELKQNNTTGARDVYVLYLKSFPWVKTWVKYIEFQMDYGNVTDTRGCFETALKSVYGDEDQGELYIRYAKFEEGLLELERARLIYRTYVDKFLNQPLCRKLLKEYFLFEKNYGDTKQICESEYLMMNARFEYLIRENPLNFHNWSEYIQYEANSNCGKGVEELYRRCIACKPSSEEKWKWKLYIQLWIDYFSYLEKAQDLHKTRVTIDKCLRTIPHYKFTFAKVWIWAAQFELRRREISAARGLLDEALRHRAKPKIYKEYIKMEMGFGNTDRCRELFKDFVRFFPSRTDAWLMYAKFEIELKDTERVENVFWLALLETEMDKPDLLQKAYDQFKTHGSFLGE